MRHALGLHGGARTRFSAGGSQPQRRRFVRDGEVPVTVIRRNYQPDGEHGANQLDAARQAIRSEATAKERAERLLEEAQAMVRDLQTKLGHEHLAKDEALETVRRLETETGAAVQAQHTAEAELAAERLARRNAKDALAEALEACREAEGRRRDAMSARTDHKPSKPSITRTATIRPRAAASGVAEGPDSVVELHAGDTPANTRMAEAPTIVEDGPSKKQVRRRGRPAETGNPNSKVIEWWKPGWQRKLP
jgi:hypothetical protein